MRKHIATSFCIAVTMLTVMSFSVCAVAWGVPTAENSIISEKGIMFGVACHSTDDVKAAVEAGARFVSLSGDIDLKAVYDITGTDAAVILDADTLEQASELHSKAIESGKSGNTYMRIKQSAKKVRQWAKLRAEKPNLIAYYKGNIYFSAVNTIKGLCGDGNAYIAQMQTGNPYGVVLHNTVTKYFEKKSARGMFSAVDSTTSAQRTDTPQGWDDLIARGYDIIETAYPQEFAEYLAANSLERTRLEESVKQAKAVSVNGCPSNRVADYNKALKAADGLLNDGSSSTVQMANARVELDLAVKNIFVSDGKHIKGDVAFSPARIIAAVFGVALVVAMQAFFRSRWKKKV